jgi:phosphoribosylaminoimidazolecarboxamide formyltransferase / IMP cyclohydrolase
MSDADEFGKVIIGDRQYELIEELKYGTNPHHRCVRLGLPSSLSFYDVADPHPAPLSSTNVQDIDLGLRLLVPYQPMPALALVKHVNPFGMTVGESGATVPSMFRAAQAASPATTHGTLVTTGVVDSSLVEELLAHPMHVVAAAGFTPEALKALSDEVLYARMRSLRLIKIAFPQLADRVSINVSALADGTLLLDWHAARPPGDTALSNSPAGRGARQSMLLASHVSEHCRTLSAVVVSGLTVIALESGHSNAVTAVTAALAAAAPIRDTLDASLPVVLASDGHFAVADPVPALSKHEVRYLVVAGGQAEDSQLIQRAAAAGVHVSMTHRRAFRH